MSDEALQRSIPAGRKSRLQALRNDSPLLLLALPGVIVLVLFAYLPMSGLILVFKNYNYNGGIFGSPWAGFDNFDFFFSSMDSAIRATRNTVMLNVLYMFTGTFFSVAIAIILNELRSRSFIKITQSVMFFPYFISWIVIGAMMRTDIARRCRWEEWPIWEDWDWWVQAWQAGATFEQSSAVYIAHSARGGRNSSLPRADADQVHRDIARRRGLPVPA